MANNKNGKTYDNLQKALSALVKFRAESESSDTSEENVNADAVRTGIVKHTDWGKLNDVINGLKTATVNNEVQRYLVK